MSTQRQARSPKPIPDPLDPEETLRIERPWRPRLAIMAILAGVLPMIANVLQILATRDLPRDPKTVVSVPDALTSYASGSQGGGLHGFQAEQVAAYGDEAGLIVASSVATAIGLLLAAPVLHGLLRGAFRRRPSFPKWFLWLPFIGVTIFAIGSSLGLSYRAIHMSDFAGLPLAEQTNHAASDAFQSAGDDLGPLLAVSGVAQMLFAVSIGAAGLSAMNVGLITRAMGIIGVILAVLVVIPIVDQQGFLRSFWLIAIGFLLLNRWPGGRPVAWDDGRPHPWPTRAEQMEALERAAAAKKNQTSPAQDGDEPAPTPKSSGNRRKRRK